MILITGGTGFIGQSLTRHLVEAGHQVRLLIRPSKSSPKIPIGVPVEVAVTSLTDGRGLRSSMVDVSSVFHLVGGEWGGVQADLMKTDIEGTQAVTDAAIEAGVERIYYLSHLDADRASAYPVLKAKAIAEEYIRRSGIDYTILRSALVYGPLDKFTTGLAKIVSTIPYVFFLPGEGNTLIQPLWVEDLAICLTWALDNHAVKNRTIEIGGPEYLSMKQVVEYIMHALEIRRKLIPMRPSHIRILTVMMEHIFPSMPLSVYWLDYLATNRICRLDSVPKEFNLLPSQFSQRIAYLQGKKWNMKIWQAMRCT